MIWSCYFLSRMVGIFTQFWYNRTIRKFRGDKHVS